MRTIEPTMYGVPRPNSYGAPKIDACRRCEGRGFNEREVPVEVPDILGDQRRAEIRAGWGFPPPEPTTMIVWETVRDRCAACGGDGLEER